MTDLRKPVHAIQTGEIIAFPTETLWSLSCAAYDEEAVQRIFHLKGRPDGVPLAVGFHSWMSAQRCIESTPIADALADRFLPGPLSIVLPRRDARLAHVAPGLDTLSVRVPSGVIASRLLDATGPLVMTSANLHGDPDPITVQDVRDVFPDILVVGERVPGTASTIVDGRDGTVLREGQVPAAEIALAISQR